MLDRLGYQSQESAKLTIIYFVVGGTCKARARAAASCSLCCYSFGCEYHAFIYVSFAGFVNTFCVTLSRWDVFAARAIREVVDASRSAFLREAHKHLCST